MLRADRIHELASNILANSISLRDLTGYGRTVEQLTHDIWLKASAVVDRLDRYYEAEREREMGTDAFKKAYHNDPILHADIARELKYRAMERERRHITLESTLEMDERRREHAVRCMEQAGSPCPQGAEAPNADEAAKSRRSDPNPRLEEKHGDDQGQVHDIS